MKIVHDTHLPALSKIYASYIYQSLHEKFCRFKVGGTWAASQVEKTLSRKNYSSRNFSQTEIKDFYQSFL